MSDYLVKMRVYNGPLFRLLKQRGIGRAKELSDRSGVPYGTTIQMLNLKTAPYKGGTWTSHTLTLARFFNVIPEVMFPEQHIEKPLPKNYAEFEASLQDMERISREGITDPQHHIDHLDAQKLLTRALGALDPKDRYVLEETIIHGRTLDDVAKEMGVSGPRVRQRQWKALHNLKHPRYKLKFAGDAMGMFELGDTAKIGYERDSDPRKHHDAYMKEKALQDEYDERIKKGHNEQIVLRDLNLKRREDEIRERREEMMTVNAWAAAIEHARHE
jgi:RNA polymerase sigma factor (sigma-70 family)